MSILDKLMEKKDLTIYIKARIARLRHDSKKAMGITDPSRREMIRQRFNGRIMELNELLEVISEDKLKDKSKEYYKYMGKGVK